jgi:hypothetical protein
MTLQSIVKKAEVEAEETLTRASRPLMLGFKLASDRDRKWTYEPTDGGRTQAKRAKVAKVVAIILNVSNTKAKWRQLDEHSYFWGKTRSESRSGSGECCGRRDMHISKWPYLRFERILKGDRRNKETDRKSLDCSKVRRQCQKRQKGQTESRALFD